MKPITSPADAAGFARELLAHVECAKACAHEAIEQLSPAVHEDDSAASDATLSISRVLSALLVVEGDLAKVIEGTNRETAEALS